MDNSYSPTEEQRKFHNFPDTDEANCPEDADGDPEEFVRTLDDSELATFSDAELEELGF